MPLYIHPFESVAIPHNTLVLFGSYGIVPSSKIVSHPKSSIGVNRRGYSGYGGLEKLRYRHSAKSIAPRKSHVPKNLHGGLRGDMRGWWLKC